MQSSAPKTPVPPQQKAAASPDKSGKGSEQENHREEAANQRNLVQNAQNSVESSKSAQLVKKAEAFSASKQSPIQRKANTTGLPDQLKSGIESLSGISMDNVKVNFNSSKPAQLQAHAFAQGEQIHIAPGQEKHLPHEAWHVVQQKQGRVKATRQLKGKVKINDDAGLEREADQMGSKAMNAGKGNATAQLKEISSGDSPAQLVEWSKNKLNVVGEQHLESGEQRAEERKYFHALVGGVYLEENELMVQSKNAQGNATQTPADPTVLRALTGLHDIVQRLHDLNRDDPPSAESILNYGFRLHISVTPLIDLVLGHWQDSQGVRYPGNLSQQETATRDNHHAGRFAALQTIKTDLNTLAALKNQKISAEVRARAIELYNQIRAQIRLLTPNLMEKANLDKLRSKRMHEAANTHANLVGVWKIGNDHVDDILQHGDKWGPRKYNLVTKAQFEHMAQNPTPAEAKALGAFDKKK